MTLVIHLGICKTGTTFLQRNVFPFIPNVNLILNNPITTKDIKILKNKINLISYEGLSGKPHIYNEDTRFSYLTKLKQQYPSAKIIIILREIQSWVYSVHNQYIKSGGKLLFNRWYNHVFNKSYLFWDEYINLIKKSFNKTLVLYFKDFKKNLQSFIQRIYSFLNIDTKNVFFINKKIGKSIQGYRLYLVWLFNCLGLNFFNFFYKIETKKGRR